MGTLFGCWDWLQKMERNTALFPIWPSDFSMGLVNAYHYSSFFLKGYGAGFFPGTGALLVVPGDWGINGDHRGTAVDFSKSALMCSIIILPSWSR